MTAAYDGAGRVTRVVDGSGRGNEYVYDAADRVTQVASVVYNRYFASYDPTAGDELRL